MRKNKAPRDKVRWMDKHRSGPCLLLLCLLAALAAAGPDPALSQPPLPQVLILDSYHQGEAASDAELAGVLKALRKTYPDLAPAIERLDAKRRPGAENRRLVSGYLADKYHGRSPDLVMAMDNPALDLLREEGGRLFPGAPVVFLGINGFAPEMIAGLEKITGVMENQDYSGTLELILRLRPQTGKVLVLVDGTSSGRAVRQEIEALLPRWQGRLELVFSPQEPFAQLEERLRELSPEWVVLMAAYTTDAAGRTLGRAEGTRLVSQASPTPVFSMSETRIGHGILGGMLLEFAAHGAQAAEMAVNILAGADPGQIPVAESISTPVFDHQQMVRFDISADALPPGSRVVNRPVSTWERHKSVIAPLLAALAMAVLGVLLLGRALLRARRAEEALRRSQERFRDLVEGTDDLVTQVDGQGRFTYVNHMAEEVFGLSPGECLGLSAFDFIHPEDRAATREQFLAWTRTHPASVILENRQVGRDGRARHMLWNCNLHFDANGEVTLINSIARDITQRKKDEQALKASERKYRRLFEHSNDAIFVHDDQGEFLDVNQRACQLLGYEREELLGLKIDDCHPPEALPAAKAAFQVLQAQGQASFETVCKRSDGSLVQVEISVSPIGEQGTVYQAMARDISERKRAEAITAARLRLMQKSAALSLEDLLRATLDEVCALTGSPVGFYHFVEPDQKTLSLAAWSTRTTLEFCRAQGAGMHYGVEQAGVWADCLRSGKPVIHNDYASLPHKKGLPVGHAPLIRELVVPTLRQDKVMTIMGVGNKPQPYLGEDADLVNHMADVAWEVISRKRAEMEMAAREEKFRSLFNSMADISALHDLVYDQDGRPTDYRIIDCNPAFSRILGIARQAAVGSLASRLYGTGQAPYLDIYAHTALTGEPARFDTFFEPMDKHFAISVFAMGKGRFATIAADVTEAKKAEAERLRLEGQLRQAQKMEAIGTLAGGIAHDFNNILAAIMGFGELALDDALNGKANPADLRQIIGSAQRASALVKQILAFSRKSEPDLRPLNLNQAVRRARAIIERTIPKMIAVEAIPGQDLPLIQGDPNQLEQVLLNLAANAADAMPEGGRLVLETQAVTLDEDFCRLRLEVRPGAYALLLVSDTGQGMDQATREQIFDPFFTTKEIGKGTGLGLSSAFGIIKNHGGHIHCYSEPGKGTTFKIYLPAFVPEKEPATPEETRLAEAGLAGRERVLIADDENPLREFVARTLREKGYQVEAAQSGEEAVQIYQALGAGLDLVILDLGMPGMGGHKALKEIMAINPQARVLIASGYTVNGQVKDSLQAGAKGYVAKPFRRTELLKAVRKALDDK